MGKHVYHTIAECPEQPAWSWPSALKRTCFMRAAPTIKGVANALAMNRAKHTDYFPGKHAWVIDEAYYTPIRVKIEQEGW